MPRLVFDIEGNNLYNGITVVHCIRAFDLDTNIMHRFDEDHEPIFRGIQLLNEGQLIGHNIIGFDIPALHKLYPKFNWKDRDVFDTIVASKLVCTNLEFTDLGLMSSGKLPKNLFAKHSLEAWGYRLGEHKGEYGKRQDKEEDEDYMERVWANYSPEMAKYCEQDVMTNVKLFRHLEEQIKIREVPQRALDIEHKFATIISRQERRGVKFDIDKAIKLEEVLRNKSAEALDILREQFKPKWFINKPAKGAGVSIEVDGEWFHDVKIYKSNRRKKIECPITGKIINSTNVIAGALCTDIELMEFNPNSGTHIIRWLTDDFGWIPSEFTKKGTPKTDSDTLESLTFEGIRCLQDYQMLMKRLSQLSDGKGSLLNKYNKDTGRIYGRCDTLGAVSRRCTHSSPNMAQVPANRVPYGKEFRDLCTVEKGYSLVGADASGLELRTLAHYLYLFDNGIYADVVLNGDIHWKNCQDAGFIPQGTIRDSHNDEHEEARGQAKTFIYAFLYGAGDMKIGEIVAPNASPEQKKAIGKKLKAQFMKSNPAIKSLVGAIKERASERKFVYDLDGNRLYIRSEHSAPNLLLQSAGAIVMKYWAVEVDRVLQEMGLENTDDVLHTDRKHDYENVLNIHDESQSEVKEELAETVAKVKEEAFSVVGRELKLNIPIDGEAKIGKSWKETH